MGKVISGIYKIVCLVNNKIYVGSSIDIYRRWHEHKSMLNNGTHHSPYLQHSWDKYGEENFSFCILEIVEDKKSLVEREQFWIDKTKCADKRIGFNVSPKAQSSLGGKHSEETKALLSELASKRKGRKVSAETRMKMRLAAIERNKSREYIEKQRQSHVGKKLSPEARAKISKAHVGKKPPNLGIKHKPETIEKLRAKAKRGSKSPKAVLREEEIPAIRKLLDAGESCQKIADKFGVHRGTIYDIKQGKTWKHI